MTIRVLCDQNEPGAFVDEHWTKQVQSYHPDRLIHVREFAKGATVAMREANGYDDSDFFATYYDAEQDKFVEVMYGTTRGWTYPANATIDATQEIAAKYEAHLKAMWRARAEREAAIEAKRPRKGKRCLITAKRGKAAKFSGQEGTIFWTQEMRSQYGTWHYGTRVGVDVNGERVFVNDTGIIVVACDDVAAA